MAARSAAHKTDFAFFFERAHEFDGHGTPIERMVEFNKDTSSSGALKSISTLTGSSSAIRRAPSARPATSMSLTAAALSSLAFSLTAFFCAGVNRNPLLSISATYACPSDVYFERSDCFKYVWRARSWANFDTWAALLSLIILQVGKRLQIRSKSIQKVSCPRPMCCADVGGVR